MLIFRVFSSLPLELDIWTSDTLGPNLDSAKPSFSSQAHYKSCKKWVSEDQRFRHGEYTHSEIVKDSPRTYFKSNLCGEVFILIIKVLYFFLTTRMRSVSIRVSGEESRMLFFTNSWFPRWPRTLSENLNMLKANSCGVPLITQNKTHEIRGNR